MRKASGKGRGRGAYGARGGRGSGRGARENVAEKPSGSSTIPSFISRLAGRRGTQLSEPDHCEQVVGWMADNSSSLLPSTTLSSTRSSLTSQESGPHHAHSDPPSSHHGESQQKSDPTCGHSEELFTFPYTGLSPCTFQEGHEEIVCSDAQILEQPRSEEGGGERQLVSLDDDDDDDETQLPMPTSDVNIEIQSQTSQEDQSEQVEDEVVDDEGTDPTWEGAMQSEDSSAEGEESAAPRQTGRGSGVARGQRRSAPVRHETVPQSTHTRKGPNSRPRCSPVWRFFVESADDKRTVICNLCRTKISRGLTTTSLTTTSMLRHMSSKHPTRWAERLGPQSVGAGDTTASSQVIRASQSPVQDAGADSSRPAPVLAPLRPPSSTTSTMSQRSVQLSVAQAFERKRKYPANHPQAQTLNSHISRMLALEMLPFRLVEAESFRSLMAAAVPRYSVPSRHYFSRTAIPALHQHVSNKITRAMTNAVTGKVHLTTDTWTSACGQGRYISLTAHWVNVVEAGTESDPGTAHVLPTPRIAGPSSIRVSSTSYASSCTPSSSSSSSELSSRSLPSTSVGSWKHCSTALGKRQQALLKLICLGDKQHTAAELLKGITDQTDLWLSPLNLQPGMVVCDNGRNLVAALELGKLTHIPCLAHVLNLVVQRFLKTYPDLPELLVKVRRVCAHFRKSPTSSAGLAVLQQRKQLPAHRLLCDVTTRWNSTLHMLERLCEQQSAVVEHQLQHARRFSGQPPHITTDEWAWMSDICVVLRNFEESTKMVSGDDAIISVTIPLLCLLKRSLLTIKEEALCVDQVEMGEESIQRDSQPSLMSQRTLSDIEEEEEEQEMVACTTEPSTHTSFIPSVRRGWAEEEEEREDEEEVEGTAAAGEREVLPVGSLAHMADFMSSCLSRDPRVIRILANNDYWMFTLLDPRYKENFLSLLPTVERASKMQQYKKALVDKLLRKFPSDNAGGRGHSSLSNQGGAARQTHTRSDRGKGTLSKVWDSFIRPTHQPVHDARGSVTKREKFWKMVKEYLADRTGVLRDSSVPFNYWVSKLDTWHELSLYALEVLACPAASVLSERVFSAAGGIITDKRTRLSTENADRLTLIKMNQAWVGADFSTPPDDNSGT